MRSVATLNIEEDHLDFFKDIHDIRHSFRLFAENTAPDGVIVLNGPLNSMRLLQRDFPRRSLPMVCLLTMISMLLIFLIMKRDVQVFLLMKEIRRSDRSRFPFLESTMYRMPLRRSLFAHR